MSQYQDISYVIIDYTSLFYVVYDYYAQVYYILNIMFFLCVTYFDFNFAMLLPLLKKDTGRGVFAYFMRFCMKT